MVIVFVILALAAGYLVATQAGALLGAGASVVVFVACTMIAGLGEKRRTDKVLASIMPTWRSKLRGVLDDAVPQRHGRMVWEEPGLYLNGVSGTVDGRPAAWWIAHASRNGRVDVRAAVRIDAGTSFSIEIGRGSGQPGWPAGVVLADAGSMEPEHVAAVNYIDPELVHTLFARLGAHQIETVAGNWLVFVARGLQPMPSAAESAGRLLETLGHVASDIEDSEPVQRSA